ncbi:tRNA (adenosine(37)-N6)-threonylcarbamoyltransferase complex dimerization subunit type 1 TsaB [Sphingobacterium corticibacterium]|uniref:tRNA (Adenosine(37)-N6)-threonylcarbamoyltransferase complex dimerization subunit type 1 TsaB n=1 Tax=Sphingobacterium corticibacterium TaxID=2484746 RepID=A0A4Q6XJA9_9SPHI|nr:tRNA (adenosine(37)-N6)-threonylcarbamoyltransferase complex dimerization subunit type 1 TsaB [Sphingobacterium corticibacterium]RZF59405.1 tRNA (adenosine(37)-N6)-threonylcarbamoyltransferase complex dimerization subunit type 1 TsaB [Sphingobacterium corticibacterium]
MIENTYILQIETATPVCSVAIGKNGKTIATVEADGPNLHASSLTLFIEEVLERAVITRSDLHAVAISKGPGSYTGLRIGVSTAKGLCYALDIPLIAVNTLEAMVSGFVSRQNGSVFTRILVPMIDARRMEVYMAKYNAQLECIAETTAHIIDESSFSEVGEHTGYVLFGSGADKLDTLFEDQEMVQVQVGFRNAASFFDKLAFQKFQQGAFENIIYFEPYYLKDFIATTPKKR